MLTLKSTARPAAAMFKLVGRIVAALTVAILLTLGLGTIGAVSASAADWGGDGNPAAGCNNGFVVKSVPLVGQRGPTAGKVIGNVELRWSWACGGNWSRVVLYGGMYPNTVTVEQVVESEGRRAGANDRVTPGSLGASSWTPFLRLANSQSTACAQAWVSSNFGTLNFHTVGARVCA